MQRIRLYKYFSEKEMGRDVPRRINPVSLTFLLSRFRRQNIREDDKEGVSIFRPEGGLVMHNKTQGTTTTLPGHGLETVVKRDEIFVFCASTSPRDELRQSFNAVACVEISDVDAFCTRVRGALPWNAKFPGPPGHERIGKLVEYYCEGGDCNPRWALPDVIATSKRETYAWQDEFRLVFSLSDALDFEKIVGRIVLPGSPRPPQKPQPLCYVCQYVTYVCQYVTREKNAIREKRISAMFRNFASTAFVVGTLSMALVPSAGFARGGGGGHAGGGGHGSFSGSSARSFSGSSRGYSQAYSSRGFAGGGGYAGPRGYSGRSGYIYGRPGYRGYYGGGLYLGFGAYGSYPYYGYPYYGGYAYDPGYAAYGPDYGYDPGYSQAPPPTAALRLSGSIR